MRKLALSRIKTSLFLSCHLWALLGLLLCFQSGKIAAQPCNNTTVLNLNGPATTTWTAPSTGGPFSVQITATGASGGSITNIFFNSGGHGAQMSGTFVVQAGETIRAIAGDFGKNATLEGAGAGGGSGAVNCGNPSNCADGTILIIAAGGNGGDIDPGLGGSSLTDGDGEGGNLGGDPNGDPGGGGGGLLSPGESDPTPFGGGQGGGQVSKTTLSPGGWGSRTQVLNDGGAGMGGGGGGGDYGAGGGGGHTGADGGNNSAAKSFNAGSNPINTDGAPGINFTGNPVPTPNTGHVTIICLGSLPVALKHFKAAIQDKTVRLIWSTASEKNNLGFEVEHSVDNRHWSTLGFVQGNGTTNTPNDYHFTDETPLPGINYYRLKQKDQDGKFEYSPIVVADVRSTHHQFGVFPNPATGALSFRVISAEEGTASLSITDVAGYTVYKETVQVLEGTTLFPVSMTTFPRGTYTARFEMPDGKMLFHKILLQ